MAPIVNHLEIDRPPAAVFGYMTDPERFGEWQPDVVKVQLEQEGPVTLGSRFTTVRRIGGIERRLTQEVTELDDPRAWAARGVRGAIRAGARIVVEPLDGGARSRVTIELDFTGRGFGDLVLPAVRRMAARQAPQSYRSLKERLEGDR
jgi:uncharacterized protein YndB with AHSA1/START domain